MPRSIDAAFLLALAESTCGVEIGVGARIDGFFVLDHTSGTVIGQQSEIGSNVLMMHGVTLGAVGLRSHQPLLRHPRIGSGVCLGSNSTVLGNVQIGHCSMVAAGAVLNKAVMPYNVAVGLPSKLVS
ncbi:MAG: serine O-acetyltransferase [Candidatus Hodgkinia cicadicola]